MVFATKNLIKWSELAGWLQLLSSCTFYIYCFLFLFVPFLNGCAASYVIEVTIINFIFNCFLSVFFTFGSITFYIFQEWTLISFSNVKLKSNLM